MHPLLPARDPLAGQRRIVSPPFALRHHGAEQVIIKGDLQAISPLRVSGKAQELVAKLHPSGRGAGFHRLFQHFSLLHRSVAPQLLVRYRAGDHQLVPQDDLRTLQAGRQIPLLAGGSV